MKKLTAKPEPKMHHAQISDELWALLVASAKQDLRSPASQIAYILRNYLANEGGEHA